MEKHTLADLRPAQATSNQLQCHVAAAADNLCTADGTDDYNASRQRAFKALVIVVDVVMVLVAAGSWASARW